MTCGACGATIAEKAIICYRCGAPTAAPAAAKASAGRRSPVLAIVIVAIAVGLAALAVWLPAGSTGRLASGAGAVAAVLLLAVRRRRPVARKPPGRVD